MAEINGILRYEGILLLRSKVVLLFPLLYTVYLIYFAVSFELQPTGNLGRVFYLRFITLVQFLPLAMSLFAVYLAQKDHQSHFDNLLLSWRVSNSKWLIGKWVLLQGYALVFALMTSVAQGVLFGIEGYSFSLWAEHVVLGFSMMEGALFGFSSLGYFVGTVIKNRITYVLMAGAWVGMLDMQTNIWGSGFVDQRWKLLSDYYADYDYSFFSGIWELQGAFGQALLHAADVVVIGVLFLLLTLFLFLPTRRTKREAQVLTSTIVGVGALVIVLYGMRYSQIEQKQSSFMEAANFYKDPTLSDDEAQKSELDKVPTDVWMEREDLALSIPKTNTIAVNGSLVVSYHGSKPASTLYLTLHRKLQVRMLQVSSQLQPDQKLTWEREGDWIKIDFAEPVSPGQRIEMQIGYTGDIEQYQEGGQMQYTFSDGPNVHLSKEIGWYPMAGKRTLARSYEYNGGMTGLRYTRMIEPNATEYSVKIADLYYSQHPLAMSIPKTGDGIYAGKSSYGLFVIAGNLKEYTADGIRFVEYKLDRMPPEEHDQERIKQWKFLESWLGGSFAPKVSVDTGSLNELHGMFQSREVKTLGSYPESLLDIGGKDHPFDHQVLIGAVNFVVAKHVQAETKGTPFMYYYQSARKQTKFNQKTLQNEPIPLPAKEMQLAERVSSYEKQGNVAFEEMVKYLYLKYLAMGPMGDFDIASLLKQYDQQKGQVVGS